MTKEISKTSVFLREILLVIEFFLLLMEESRMRLVNFVAVNIEREKEKEDTSSPVNQQNNMCLICDVNL